MNRVLIAGAIVLATVLSAHAKTHHKRHHATDGTVVYNQDSKDPNVGWHTENGFRTCHADCDNPEIPGSGAVCKDVTFMGMAMRQCER